MGSNGSPDDYEIVIDGEHFSLLGIPQAGSRLVKAEMLHALQTIPLGELMAKLQRAGDLIRLACHSTPATAGSLRTDMGHIHERFGVLCSECMQETDAIQSTTKTLLSAFNRVTRKLLGGDYRAALAFMARACDGTKKFGVSLSALSAEFDRLADLSSQTLQASQEARGQGPGDAEELEKNTADLRAMIAMAEALNQQLEHRREALQALFDEAHQRADQSGGRAFALSMVGTILAPVAQATGAVAGAYMTARHPAKRFLPPDLPQSWGETPSRESAEDYRQEKLKYLDLLMAGKDWQIEMSANLRKYAIELNNAGVQEKTAEIPAKALFNGVVALRQVAVLLRGMAHFWSDMAAHCDRLADSGVVHDVQMAQDMPIAFRQSIFTDPLFQTEVLTCIAGWVALDCIAGDSGMVSAEICSKAMAARSDCLDDAGVQTTARLLGTQLLGDVDTGLNAAHGDRQAIVNEKAKALCQAT